MRGKGLTRRGRATKPKTDELILKEQAIIAYAKEVDKLRAEIKSRLIYGGLPAGNKKTA